MGDPRYVRPDEVEILVTRELRKAGFNVSSLARSALARADGSDFSLSLEGNTIVSGQPAPLAVEFCNQPSPVSVNQVGEFAARPQAGSREDGPKRLMQDAPSGPQGQVVRAMVSTSGFAIDAVRAAAALGMTLFAVADGPAAFRRSQWSMGQQTPAWLPEYIAERIDLGPDGSVRRTLLVGTSQPVVPGA